VEVDAIDEPGAAQLDELGFRGDLLGLELQHRVHVGRARCILDVGDPDGFGVVRESLLLELGALSQELRVGEGVVDVTDRAQGDTPVASDRLLLLGGGDLDLARRAPPW